MLESAAAGLTLAQPPMPKVRGAGSATSRSMPGSESVMSTGSSAWGVRAVAPARSGKSAVARWSRIDTALCERSRPPASEAST